MVSPAHFIELIVHYHKNFLSTNHNRMYITTAHLICTAFILYTHNYISDGMVFVTF